MRLLPLLLPLLIFSGCIVPSLRKPPTLEESLKEKELRDYYRDVQNAFAQGDAKALADLFDPSIAKPMTYGQILAWGEKFFGEHGPALFHVDKMEILELGWRRAVTRLTYRVKTKSGRGDFGGAERNSFIRKDGRWLMSSWEKEP